MAAGGNKGGDIQVKLRGDVVTFPVAAAERIYRGTMVAVQSGYAEPCGDVGGHRFVGIAEEESNNASGAIGATNVRVRRHGIFRLKPKTAAHARDVGRIAYLATEHTASVDEKVAARFEVVNDVPIGRVLKVDTTNSWWFVDIDDQLTEDRDPAYGGWRDDFTTYTATDWTLTTTEAGTGSATEVVTDAADGVLLVTNAAGDNDEDEFQRVGEQHKLAADKPLTMKFYGQISDITQSDFWFGLHVTDTTILGGTSNDHVLVLKNDGDANLDTSVDKDGSATAADSTVDMVAATNTLLGIEWDGLDTVRLNINGTIVSVTTNIPNDEYMRVSFGLANGEAVVKTMSIDYVEVWQARGA